MHKGREGGRKKGKAKMEEWRSDGWNIAKRKKGNRKGEGGQRGEPATGITHNGRKEENKKGERERVKSGHGPGRERREGRKESREKGGTGNQLSDQVTE